ncbi:putative formin-2 [Iris pallida]|uniref:Formin-2 n=1 Tax=Iris pallida TaxID=29817 RepID=A0AAX6HAQ2_IRIPA|nr:putative formin-2 [Iris pallida]KAJ6842407.1 putative formin-2 [Iris pallida]
MWPASVTPVTRRRRCSAVQSPPTSSSSRQRTILLSRRHAIPPPRSHVPFLSFPSATRDQILDDGGARLCTSSRSWF